MRGSGVNRLRMSARAVMLPPRIHEGVHRARPVLRHSVVTTGGEDGVTTSGLQIYAVRVDSLIASIWLKRAAISSGDALTRLSRRRGG